MGSADRFSTPANATFVPLRRSSIDAWLNMREFGSLSNQSRSSFQASKIGATQKHRRLPQDVAESPSLARTTAQAPRLRGPGGSFSSRLRQHRERRAVTAWGGS
jgi:hypothetical protein